MLVGVFTPRHFAGASLACIALAVTSLAIPESLGAQAPVRTTRPDSAHADSTRATRLGAVTIATTPASREEPQAVSHIALQTLRLTPSTTVYDLMRQAGGLEVHQQGQGPGFASNASLRGFSSDHSTDLALWIDGVPINEPVNGHSEGYGDWTVLFPGAVRDVDLIHGPSSALFGNFALAGVVNVRTLERMHGSEVSVSGGSFGRGEVTIMSGFDHGVRGGGVFGARYEHEDGFRPNGAFDVMQLHARTVHELRPGITYDAGVEVMGSRWKSSGFLSSDEFTAHHWSVISNPSDGGEKERAQERFSVRALLGDVSWRSTLFATQSRWQLFLTIPPEGGRFEGSGSQSEEEDHRFGFGLTSALTKQVGGVDLTVGVESRFDHSKYESYFTTNRARDSVAANLSAHQLSGALFAQLHADVTDRLRLDLGLRADAFYTHTSLEDGTVSSDTRPVVSPKLGGMYRLTPELGLYANASRGFRAPNGLIIDPSLAPITVWSYESGVKWDRNGASVSAGIFQMDVSNEQTFDPVTLTSTDGGRSRRQGLELEWSVPLGGSLSTSGSWTFLDARYRQLTALSEDGNEPPAVLDGLRVYNTSKYTGTAALDLVAPDAAWRLRVAGAWVGPYSPFDAPGVVRGGYGLLQLSGSVRWNDTDWTVGVRNALNRAYPELVAGTIVAPGQPRAIQLGVRRVF